MSMETNHPELPGLWLPLITPFRDGALDETSLRRLVAHYAAQPVDGLILGATTGEGLSLDDAETQLLVSVTSAALDAAGRSIPIYLGISRSEEHTSELQSLMRISYAVFCLKKKTMI